MNVAKITAELTHLDEAVMEMQPDQGRRHPGLPGDGLRHDGPHDLIRLRARVVVEVRVQLPAAGRCQERERRGRDARRRHESASHRGCHC